MQHNKVSVILPTYNRPDKIWRSVDSIINQTYENIEIIIVDDASQNEYVYEIPEVSSTEYEFIIIRHSQNMGLAAARNTGIKAANGKYIAFLDDDDVWEPTKISKQVEVMKNEERPVNYTWMDRVDEHGNVRSAWKPTATGIVRRQALTIGLPGPPAICIEKEVLEQLGGFDESLPAMEESDLGIQLVDKYEYSCVPEVLVHAEVGGEPSNEYITRKKQAVDALIDKHTPLPDRFGQSATQEYKSSLYSSLGMSALKSGSYSIARNSYIRALQCNPRLSEELIYLAVSLGGPLTHKPALFIKKMFFDQASSGQNTN